MAATSHPTATLTAIEVLKAGGKAIDAAVAACAVQGVVEAGSTGLGGDCFAMLAPEGSDRLVAYNGSGRTPAALTLDGLKRAGVDAIERRSPHAVTVPGAVDAWARLVADHGRMSLAQVLEPALGLARDGYGITPRVAHDLAAERDVLTADPLARRTFLVNDAVPAVGSIQRQPELAATLEAIASEGRAVFYEGPVAADIVERLRDLGGLHTREDFAGAAGQYVSPIAATYRGWTVHECPPNGQGVIALLILKILERFTPKPDPLDIDNLVREVEATRLAYGVRDAWLADPATADIPLTRLLSDELAAALAARIDVERAADPARVADVAEHRDTVTLSVVDRDRNAVSLINSLFWHYGSGIMAQRSGVLLNNRGMGFVMTERHPNAIGPRKRPLHTIIPGMVTRDGRVMLSFGVMGGHYQAMGHAHLLSKLFDHGLDLQSAIDLPRLFPLPGTRTLEVEGRLRAHHGAELERRGFEVVQPETAIGGAQAILVDWEHGTLLGGSDPRKDGCALGI